MPIQGNARLRNWLQFGTLVDIDQSHNSYIRYFAGLQKSQVAKNWSAVHLTSDPLWTRHSRQKPDPTKMECKSLVRAASRHSSVCHPETKWVWPVSGTRLIKVFHRLPSNVHFTCLWFHTRIIGAMNLFDFATIFTQITAQSCTGKKRNLQWKNWIAYGLSFKIMSHSGHSFRNHNFGIIDWLLSNPG